MSARSDYAMAAGRRSAGRRWRRGLVYLPVALAYLFVVALLVAPPERRLSTDDATVGLQVTAASAAR